MGCLLSLLLLQMLSALTAAGLGAQEVEHLWACYEKAKAAEDKAGFATGQQQQSSLLPGARQGSLRHNVSSNPPHLQAVLGGARTGPERGQRFFAELSG